VVPIVSDIVHWVLSDDFFNSIGQYGSFQGGPGVQRTAAPFALSAQVVRAPGTTRSSPLRPGLAPIARGGRGPIVENCWRLTKPDTGKMAAAALTRVGASRVFHTADP
jgi:hypothetical protein